MIEILLCFRFHSGQLRAEHVVPRRMVEMEEAILKKDFEKFADLTMKVCVYLCNNLPHKKYVRVVQLIVEYTNTRPPCTFEIVSHHDW